MNIEVYCPVNNEEKMIGYFIRHYSQFAKVILLVNNSTDKTVSIAKSLGAEIREVICQDEQNEEWLQMIKNTCWKESKAEWVIIADADEFVYHPDLVEILKRTKATIFQPEYFNMFSKMFPKTKGQIYDSVKKGLPGGIWTDKANVFKPSEITDINYGVGGHSATPTGNVIYRYDDLMTLHMRFLSEKYVISRHKQAAKRYNAQNRLKGWGVQYFWNEEKTKDFIKFGIENSIKLL
jgi:glycosyltransferase involved in cell wall biosynthesis